jgi:hypothetical protein
MSDHEIIPPVNMDTSDSLQRRNHSKKKDKKKKHHETPQRKTEPKPLKDQDIVTAPDSDHLIDYEA